MSARKTKRPTHREPRVNLKAKIENTNHEHRAELAVVIPPEFEAAGDVLRWLEGPCIEWLRTLGTLAFMENDRKHSVSGEIAWNLEQLIEDAVRGLRRGACYGSKIDSSQWRHTLRASRDVLQSRNAWDDEGRSIRTLTESAEFYACEAASRRKNEEGA